MKITDFQFFSDAVGHETQMKNKPIEINCPGSGTRPAERTTATATVVIKSTEGAVANPLIPTVASTSKHVESRAVDPIEPTASEPSNPPAPAAIKPVEVHHIVPMAKGDVIRWDRMRERLLERMKNTRRENENKTKVEKMISVR